MANIKNLDDLKNLDKMEAFKAMSEGMDAKKNKKPHVCGNLVQCVVGIVMLSIGAVYYDDCQFDATTYLVVGGSVMLITNLLGIIAVMTPAEWDDKLTKSLTPLIGLIQFCIFLWGTIVVFGHYAWWIYDENSDADQDGTKDTEELDDEKRYYCHYTPYMFAFILLILKWVLLPCILMLCCCCACLTACCACCCKGAAGDGGTVEPVGSVQQSQTSLQQEKKMDA